MIILIIAILYWSQRAKKGFCGLCFKIALFQTRNQLTMLHQVMASTSVDDEQEVQ